MKEAQLIKEIGLRAHRLTIDSGLDSTIQDRTLDIIATHIECPLRLSELAKSDDLNFSHDIFGIMRHLNRKTGKLENCFTPRFAIHN